MHSLETHPHGVACCASPFLWCFNSATSPAWCAHHGCMPYAATVLPGCRLQSDDTHGQSVGLVDMMPQLSVAVSCCFSKGMSPKNLSISSLLLPSWMWQCASKRWRCDMRGPFGDDPALPCGRICSICCPSLRRASPTDGGVGGGGDDDDDVNLRDKGCRR